MADFNLIPPSYSARLERLQTLRYSGAGLAVVLVLGIAVGLTLGNRIDVLKTEVAELQQRQEVSARQRSIIADLNAQKKELEQQWRLLDSLRSGMPAKRMLETVQTALRTDEVWFVEWRLRRAGIVTEKETAANQPGYFVIVKRTGNTEDWRSMTHMTIRGQARDHSALSEFAQRLLNAPDIADVHVQKTTQGFGRDQRLGAVDFDLAIVLDTELGRS